MGVCVRLSLLYVSLQCKCVEQLRLAVRVVLPANVKQCSWGIVFCLSWWSIF